MQSVIHIVPQLPPQNSGVGDYATLVGRRMEEVDDGVVCGYVAAGQEAVELPADGPRVRNVTGRSDAAALWRGVEELGVRHGESSTGSHPEGTRQGAERGSVSVVLHYSGYGFERNGCPAWLVEVLRNRPAWVGRVVTYFHELYATGRPWQRAFWYSSRHRRITTEVARLSDGTLTNRAESARWLEDATGRPAGSIRALPTPSNVGEMATPTRPSDRDRIAACFGAAQFKQSFLNQYAKDTADICAAAGVQEIENIGGPTPVDVQTFADRGIQIEQSGFLPAASVSERLSSARLAFVEYFPGYLAKSGSIAAFAAHGVPTIMSDACSSPADGLVPGQQYLCLTEANRLAMDGEALGERLDQIGSNLFKWYQTHNIEAHARSLLELATGHSMATQLPAVSCSRPT